ncbi:MAG: adenosine kinase [Rhodospirillaceae bacterium]|jgi:sugar/nucleoside kinase (ribokinase family)|nr:adenosine kinase [Rhodospirillaceae bacterium]MBT7268921.1 adenosine kinase [Rhodospirillaceae bacterium]
MSDPKFDVVGIGNAIVDVLAHAEDAFLEEHGLAKGAMTIIDAETAENIYGLMGSGVEMSGGSAANTIAGIASLGGAGAFIGKVCKDQLGEVFTHDIRAAGVSFETAPDENGAPTARCLICVTPDAERTMQTFLGACVDLGPEDVDDQIIGASKVLYLEGYLYDPPRAKEAFVKAAKIAEQSGRQVALSLSDPFCVDRYRDEFCDLVENHVNILFANEDEIKSLYQVDGFDEALQQVRGNCEIVALTRSSQGSVVVAGDEVHVLDAEKVEHVVDTTGAGDSYAAGFLYGLTQGRDLATCGRIGGILAAEIISHYGARAESDLKAVLAEKLK